MQLKTGGRYRSQVCDTEFIVVKPLPGDLDLTCGGHPAIDIKATPAEDVSLASGADGGSLLGKRYTDASGKLEVLITKAGKGTLALQREPLQLKEAEAAAGQRLMTASGEKRAERVVLITGAARGQGRAHALAFAEQGADVILLDACASVAPVGYPPASEADLYETAQQVRALGRQAWTSVVDLRDGAAVRSCVDAHVLAVGRLDVIVVNAGVAFFRPFLELTDDDWDVMIGNNLTSAQRTLTAAVPHMVEAGNGGAIVITASVAGVKVIPTFEAHYVAAKHGLVGLMRALAMELAEHRIRVNCVAPGGVATAMAQDTELHQRIFGDEHRAAQFTNSFSPLLEPYMATPEEVARIVSFLASPAARAITGHVVPIDFGVTAR